MLIQTIVMHPFLVWWPNCMQNVQRVSCLEITVIMSRGTIAALEVLLNLSLLYMCAMKEAAISDFRIH